MPSRPSLPRILVLLATRNGRAWIPEQFESILRQTGVAVRVVVSDDASTDGTREWVTQLAEADARVSILPATAPSGSAAANFYRLIRQVEVEPDEFVAFSDQDDVWMPDKLARHVALLQDRDGVSSNVTAFRPDGLRTLVKKDYPQREFDYLLESPGPGSTFLISQRLFTAVRAVLDGPDAPRVDYHDWLVYAVARTQGWGWHIDDVSSVDYRQHDDNVMGANVGAGSAASRLSLIRRRWHRGQATVLARIGVGLAEGTRRAELERMLALLGDTGIRARWRLAARAGRLRRRPRDRWAIGLLIAIGVW